MALLESSQCPSCGAPIDIHAGVKSITCDYCGSILMAEKASSAAQAPSKITDTKVKLKKEDRGPLQVGLSGMHNDVQFKIVGVLEYEDDEGWRWVEYYCKFDNGKSAWLEYDDDKYKLLFDQDLDDETWKPKIGFGKKVKLPTGQKFKVTEKSGSRILYMWGQIPFSAKPNVVINFIDGKDPNNKKLKYSIEYTKKETELFVGPSVNVKVDDNIIYIFDK